MPRAFAFCFMHSDNGDLASSSTMIAVDIIVMYSLPSLQPFFFVELVLTHGIARITRVISSPSQLAGIWVFTGQKSRGVI
jgi:hypothetical protein